jgi:transposase
VHPPEIRRLRNLTRYRRALVQDRTREQQRIEKLLEDAQIKISSVLSELHGVYGRAMMDALIAGQRDPRALARLPTNATVLTTTSRRSLIWRACMMPAL